MFLFRSKLFWGCVLFCVVIVGFSGVVSYKSQRSVEPVKIYKVVEPVPRAKSPQRIPQTQTFTEDSGKTTFVSTDSYTDLPEEESTDIEMPVFDKDDAYEPKTTDDVDLTLESDDTTTDHGMSAEEFAREMQTRAMSIISGYPIASMSESEMLKMAQTEEGLIELKQQAEGFQQEMNDFLFEYIPKLSEEAKQQAKEEARQVLLGSMTPEQVEAHLAQYPW